MKRIQQMRSCIQRPFTIAGSQCVVRRPFFRESSVVRRIGAATLEYIRLFDFTTRYQFLRGVLSFILDLDKG